MAIAFQRGAFEPSAFATAVYYTLTADYAAYAQTGYAVTISAGRKVSAAQGSYAQTGYSAAIAATRKLTLAQGAFAYAGYAASMLATRKLILAQGAFTSTGNAAALAATRKLSLSSGVLMQTGYAAVLRAVRSFPFGAASFAQSGYSASLQAARKLALAQGAFSYAGQAAGLSFGHKLTGSFSTFSLSGQPAALRTARSLAATTGAVFGQYYEVGYTARLIHGYVLGVGGASFVSYGQSVSFAAARRLPLATASFSLSGKAAQLAHALSLAAYGGSFAEVGRDVGLRAARQVALQSASLSLTGYQVAYRVDRALFPSYLSYSLNDGKTILKYARFLTPNSGGYISSGYNARLYESSFFYNDSEVIYVPSETNTMFIAPKVVDADVSIEVPFEVQLVQVEEERRTIKVPANDNIEELAEYRIADAENRMRAIP